MEVNVQPENDCKNSEESPLTPVLRRNVSVRYKPKSEIFTTSSQRHEDGPYYISLVPLSTLPTENNSSETSPRKPAKK